MIFRIILVAACVTSMLFKAPAAAAEKAFSVNPVMNITVLQEEDRLELNHWNADLPVSSKNSQKISSENSPVKNKWQYKGDEFYENFPNIFIRKNSYSPSYKNNHRRRSLSSRSGLQSMYERKSNISPSILKYAKLYDLDPHIIRSIIEIESSYNPKAYSCSGACGLMQLKPGTAYDMGITNYWDPDQNIKGGGRYISLMLKKFKTLELALAAYNQGPGAVERCGNRVPNSTARNYIYKFYKAYNRK